jgi:hypothetical protein
LKYLALYHRRYRYQHRAEDHKAPLFEVRALLEPVEVEISRLTRDQKQVDVRPPRDYHVLVEMTR